MRKVKKKKKCKFIQIKNQIIFSVELNICFVKLVKIFDECGKF